MDSTVQEISCWRAANELLEQLNNHSREEWIQLAKDTLASMRRGQSAEDDGRRAEAWFAALPILEYHDWTKSVADELSKATPPVLKHGANTVYGGEAR